jgi:hypothetical protein
MSRKFMGNHGAPDPTPYDRFIPPSGGRLAGKKFLEARHGGRALRIRWIRRWGVWAEPFQQAIRHALASPVRLEQEVIG